MSGGKRWTCAGVLCPFYKEEESSKIICEGPEDRTSMHLAFSSPAQKTEYMLDHCKAGWEKCVLTQALEMKYE